MSKFFEEYEFLAKKFNSEVDKVSGQLILLSGGTLTVFVALNSSNAQPDLVRFGFFLIGLSLVFGLLSSALKLIRRLFLILQSFLKEFDIKKGEIADLRYDAIVKGTEDQLPGWVASEEKYIEKMEKRWLFVFVERTMGKGKSEEVNVFMLLNSITLEVQLLLFLFGIILLLAQLL